MTDRLTPRRLAALAAVAQDRVTYRSSGPGTSYRVWASADPGEREYVTATPAVTWLAREGLARGERGWRWDSGYVVATPAGWELIASRIRPFFDLLSQGWR